MTFNMFYIVFAIVFICVCGSADSSCTFPPEITGYWTSSHKGDILFSSDGTTVYNYPMYMSASVNAINFTCDQQLGNKYLLKSTDAVTAFSSYIDAYVCIQLHRVSAYKYYYYLGTAQSGTNNDYVYGRLNGTAVLLNEACNRAEPYEASTFVTLVKSGSVESGLGEETCPPDLLGTFINITITSPAGSNACSGSYVDACANKVLLTYTYDGCTAGRLFSVNGSFHCLYALKSGSTTYLSLWNDDVTVDGTSTYRFTCMAFQLVGDTVFATEVPNFCSNASQDSTTVTSPGIRMVMESRVRTCMTSVTSFSSGGWIALIVLLVLLVPAGVVVGVIVIKKHKNKIGMLAAYQITSNTELRDRGDIMTGVTCGAGDAHSSGTPDLAFGFCEVSSPA